MAPPDGLARWVEGAWVSATPATISLSLTPAQWHYFLDLTGFREALDAALAAMPKEGLEARAAWAMMRSVAYASESYGLDVTLQLVAQVRALGLPVCDRFAAELGYEHVTPWPVFKDERGRRKMFYLIHASDHADAPRLMKRAYSRILGARAGTPADTQTSWI